MTSPAELSSLKAEVADLWKRFKTEEAATALDDPLRKELVGELKALDLRQKELMVRRDALRHEVDALKTRHEARQPILRTLGLVIGLMIGTATAISVAPMVADWTVSR